MIFEMPGVIIKCDEATIMDLYNCQAALSGFRVILLFYHPSAAKSYYLRFWGVHVPYFLRLFSGLDSSCNFRSFFDNLGALLAAIRSLNEPFWGAFWLPQVSKNMVLH